MVDVMRAGAGSQQILGHQDEGSRIESLQIQRRFSRFFRFVELASLQLCILRLPHLREPFHWDKVMTARPWGLCSVDLEQKLSDCCAMYPKNLLEPWRAYGPWNPLIWRAQAVSGPELPVYTAEDTARSCIQYNHQYCEQLSRRRQRRIWKPSYDAGMALSKKSRWIEDIQVVAGTDHLVKFQRLWTHSPITLAPFEAEERLYGQYLVSWESRGYPHLSLLRLFCMSH